MLHIEAKRSEIFFLFFFFFVFASICRFVKVREELQASLDELFKAGY
jgi:hypothetical protein